MKWPLRQSARPVVDRDLYDALAVRYDALLEKYHALKLQGANAPVERPKLEPATQDIVTAAIHARAAKVPLAARVQAVHAMQAWVNEQRAAGASDNELLFDLERGVEVEDVGDVVQ